MNCEHVLNSIDCAAMRDITPVELNAIREHAAQCSGCRAAFEAALISAAMLEARVAESESVEPSAFFTRKVMNAIRERAVVSQPIAIFQKWWQASFSMVALMLIALLGLVAMAIFAPGQESEAFTSSTGMYTPETVIMDQVNSKEFTNEQALEEVYSSKVEVKK